MKRRPRPSRLDKRRLRFIPLLLTIGMFVACTGGGETTDSTEGSPDSSSPVSSTPGEPGATTTTAAPVDEGGLKVVPFMTAESSPTAVARIQEIIAAFQEANPEIAIELQLVSNDLRAQRIINSVAVGEELGIFEMDRRLGPEMTEAGYLLPLDSVVESIGVENFVPGSLLYWPWDGQLYLFPSDMSSAQIYWRQDMYDQAGLAAPDSFERYLENSERLHGVDGISGNGAEISPIRAMRGFSNNLWQSCGDYFTADGEVALGSDEARSAAHDYAQAIQYTPDGSHTWGGLDVINAYVSGRVAHAIHHGRAGFEIGTNADEAIEAGTGMGFVQMFHEDATEKPTTNAAHVTTYAIGSNVKHPEEAKQFLEFMFTGDNLVSYAMGVPGHIIPPQLEAQAAVLAQDDPYVNEHRDWIQVSFDAAPTANDEIQNMGSMNGCTFEKSMVPVPWGARVFSGENPISTMFQEIHLQGRDVDEALDDAIAAFEEAKAEWESEFGEFEPPTS